MNENLTVVVSGEELRELGVDSPDVWASSTPEGDYRIDISTVEAGRLRNLRQSPSIDTIE